MPGKCPVCGDFIIWLQGRGSCCGATWAHSAAGEAPYLVSVDDSQVFQDSCTEYGTLDKEFNLLPVVVS